MVLYDIMLVEKEEDEEKIEESSAGVPTPVRTTDKPTSSSIITVDPTTRDEKEESQLKEAMRHTLI